MQSSSQYGVPEVPAQFVVGRVPSSGAHSHNIFSLAHDISLSPNNSSPHPQPQSHHSSELQQQHHGSNQQMIAHKIRLESDSPEVAAPSPGHPKLNNSTSNTTPNNYSSSNRNNNNINTDSSNKQQQQQDQVVQLGGDEDVLGSEDCERGSAGNRWPRQETLALLKIRSEMDAAFRDASLKGPLWEDVSRRLAELGYYRNAKKCKEKFENVHKYYKRTKEGRAGRQDGKSYRFFTQLEALYGNSNTGNLNNVSNSNNNNKVTLAISGGSAAPVGSLPIVVAPHVNQESREIDNSISVKVAAKPVNQTLDFSAAAALSFSSSDSSEDEDDEPEDHDHDPNRKRKRPSSSSSSESMVMFFENLMKQVIEKQETMQRKFLEAIEKREQDRMIREEAWKRQEMARLIREQELKSQERSLSASRDAALVAFLQKVTGQTLPMIPPQLPIAPQLQLLEPPPPPPPPPPSADQTDNLNIPNADQDHQVVVHHEDVKDLSSFDPNSKRWPKPEVLTLIKLRSGMEHKFHEPGPKSPLWEEISAAMARLGYNRNAKRCKEKWENINKYFRKAKESNKKRPENAKTCPYFHQLDALYKKRHLGNRQNKIVEQDSTVNGNDQKVENQETEELIEHDQPSGSNRDNTHDHRSHSQQGDHGGDILAVMPSAHGEPHAYHHERTNPNSNSTTRDASSIMAMVHKLTSDHPQEFNMSTSSNTE